MNYRRKLVIDVPEDIHELEIRHPSGEVEDLEVARYDQDDDDSDQVEGDDV